MDDTIRWRWWDQDEQDRAGDWEVQEGPPDDWTPSSTEHDAGFIALIEQIVTECIVDIVEGRPENVMAWGGISFREWV